LKIAILTTDNREHHRRYDLPEPYFGPAIDALLEGFAGMSEIEVHVVSCAQRPMKAPQKLGSNIWFHLVHVPKIGWLRTAYQGCVRATRRKLQEIEPDIVHGQGTERECAICAVKSGFPNIVTIHGNMLGVARTIGATIGSFYWLAARLETYALKRADGVLCNSAYTEKLVQQRTATQIWRVPNALRQVFFQPQPARPPNARPILLNVGTIAPHKQQIAILKTLVESAKSGVQCDVVFIGDMEHETEYAAEFLRLVSLAETQRFVRHITRCSGDELLSWYDRAEALIHFPREEAFGLVVAEALSRNLKLFAARTGGIPDIAENIELTELIGCDDWKNLSCNLAKWINCGRPRPSTAAAPMRERYSPSVIARQHLEIYRELTTRS